MAAVHRCIYGIRRLRVVFLASLAIGLSQNAFGEGRRCVFSIEILSDGGGLHRPGDTAIGDGMFIYEYSGGELFAERHEGWHGFGAPRPPVNERWGSGPEFTARIREIFRSSRIQDGDLKGTLLDSRDLRTGALLVVGGRKVHIFADLGSAKFSLTTEALGVKLDAYSPRDPNLARLKDLLDKIALEYGRTKLFLN